MSDTTFTFITSHHILAVVIHFKYESDLKKNKTDFYRCMYIANIEIRNKDRGAVIPILAYL